MIHPLMRLTIAIGTGGPDRSGGPLPQHRTCGPVSGGPSTSFKSLNNSQRHNELTDGRRPVSEKPDMRADRNTYLLVPFGPLLTTWADYDALC
ncbi:hypothetical protein Pla52o_57120 [Novipirellula galeiformis]|uniref:Uncharacterized protein n=1 Tax=Novipirellula galeiformis TaxID=2528004 RepID=A0A5C6BE68_9BACT|nr:hypothetical protein Pla52o_57120 [Novipirellula galeiformis]